MNNDFFFFGINIKEQESKFAEEQTKFRQLYEQQQQELLRKQEELEKELQRKKEETEKLMAQKERVSSFVYFFNLIVIFLLKIKLNPDFFSL